MTERELRKFLGKDPEIPEEVENKLSEAYRKLGIEKGKKEKRNMFFALNRRSWRVAAIAACGVLVLGVTVGAATQNWGGLRLLFGNSIELAQRSTKTVQEKKGDNNFENLSVDVEEMTGADDLVYLVLNIKRTDGRKFERDREYYFQSVDMAGERDGKYKEDVRNFISETESGNEYSVENEGTDEIKIALLREYECRKYDEKGSEKTFHRRGDTCDLILKDLVSEKKTEKGGKSSGVSMEFPGYMETQIKLDYGKTMVRECRPKRKVYFPKASDPKKYTCGGILESVKLNPYYIEYRIQLDKLWGLDEGSPYDKKDIWMQVCLEMKDGTKYGAVTPKDGEGAFGNISEEPDLLTYSDTVRWRFNRLIDVSGVKAVWFGKTRIPLER